MRIVFFEVQDWEKESLGKNFPQAFLTEEKLTIDNVPKHQEAEILSTFIYSTLNKEVIEKLPNLKLIATRSTGYDHIDISYCQEKKVLVANVPEYGTHTVAEHTFALILSLTRKIYPSINQVKQLDFTHQNIRGLDLYGKTLGIVGLGKIGAAVLKIAHGFGMKILVYTRSKDEKLAKKWGFKYLELEDLFLNSDIITLHAPYTEETHHLINKENILKFKRGSYLINTARGGVVETEAILLGLQKGILAGVALDVLEGEKDLQEEAEILTSTYREAADLKTLVLDHVLINHPQILITPHNAFNSHEALRRILDTTIENIKSFLKNRSLNLVTGG